MQRHEKELIPDTGKIYTLNRCQSGEVEIIRQEL